MHNTSRADTPVVLRGEVTTGKGEGEFFVSLDGYAKQFRSKLGYSPFPGTLNVDLTAESTARRPRLSAVDATRIDGWEEGDRSFGPVACYPARLVRDGRAVESVHVLVPERTDHDEDQLEVIAPVELRSAYDIDDGDQLTIEIGATQ